MAVRDVILVGIIMFTVGIIFFVINFTSNTIIDKVMEIPTINESAPTVAVFAGVDEKVNDRMDYMVFGLFLALTLGIIITGWFVGGVAIFAIIYIIVIVLAVVFATVLSYVWQQVTPASVFGTTIAAFPLTNHILSWLPYYIAVIGFIGVVVMFAKPYFAGEE